MSFVKRRQLLAGSAVLVGLAGCTRGGSRGGPRTTGQPAAPVTTTSADAIEIPVAQIVIRDGVDGPRVYYQFENTGSTDATIEVTTVLHVDAGGSYEASAYTDVPAGGEVFLEYRIVEWETLSVAEREAVERGDMTFDTYVNGDERPGV